MSYDELFVVEDTELNKMLAAVADDAYPLVIEAYNDVLSEMLDGDDENAECLMEDADYLYLYVYANGTWVIDAPDYLQDHRNIVATAMCVDYTNVDTLRYELEGSTF